jgi:cytochrome c biogenesis protein CcmG, thiol:disulfide interchange protein DsbE
MASRLKLAGQLLALAAVAGLLALLIWRVANQNGGAAAEIKAGKTPPAPNFLLSRLDRPGKLSLSSLRGKVVVLNFWASWCVPCKEESRRLEAAWRRWRPHGVVVLGADVNDFSGDAKRFMRRYRLTYPVVHDGGGSKVVAPYGLTGFPETFFVDRDGKLVGEHVDGPVTDEKLDRNIRVALRS